jgi:hypothetical protein
MLKQLIPNERSKDKINIRINGVGWINLARDRTSSGSCIDGDETASSNSTGNFETISGLYSRVGRSVGRVQLHATI